MADVKWIKITTDMFDNSKIKQLRRLPEGNNVVLIWVMLLTMAGKCNAGGMIILTENIPYTIEMLADELGFELTTVKMAIDVLTKFNMISNYDECFFISNWEEYQNVNGMEKLKEQNKERQKRFRDKKKQELLEESNVISNVTDNVTVTQSSYSISNSYSNSISNIVNYLNNKCNKNYKSNTKNTIKHIHARLEEGYTEEDFYRVIDYKSSQWLDDSKMCDYLRPDTLFGTKFESYLNSAPNTNPVVEEKEIQEDEWVQY